MNSEPPSALFLGTVLNPERPATRLRRLLWRVFHRESVRHHSEPNFLFSTWPLVEWGEMPRVVIEPTGEPNDNLRVQAALNRLDAVGGGILRLSVGDYITTIPFYIP